MTTARAGSADRGSRRGTLSVRMIAASLAAAAAIFGGLAVQMAHGHDPALGAGTQRRQTAARRRRALRLRRASGGPPSRTSRRLDLRRRDEGLVIREQQLVAREHERGFELFGTTVAHPGRRRAGRGCAPARARGRRGRGGAARLPSRAEPLRPGQRAESPERAIPSRRGVSSRLMAGAVAAAIHAAERSGGLVDPTLIGALEAAGYAESRRNAMPASLADALRVAPPRRAAGSVARRPVARRSSSRGARSGGRRACGSTSAGPPRDSPPTARRRSLAGQGTFAVDAGGDIVLGGVSETPRKVTVAHPLDDRPALEFDLTAGAVATSGLGTRIWRTGVGLRAPPARPRRPAGRRGPA